METRNLVYQTLKQYLGRKPSTSEYHIFKKQVHKIAKINYFNTDTFFFLIKKNKNRFFNELNVTDDDLKNRINNYFVKQQGCNKLGKILAILELQKILVFTFTKTIGVLTTKVPEYYHSTVKLNYEPMKKIASNILNSYNVLENVSDNKKGRHNVSDLVFYVNGIMEEYLRRHSNSCVCYGSYSLRLLNDAIDYGDIDILQTNARTFLINMAFLIMFVTGRHITLLKVPFLKNYVVILDEKQQHIMDSFNIKESTMNVIPKIMVDNMYILDPCIQLLNYIKMFSQIDRLEDIPKKFDKLSECLGTLLGYTKYRYSVSFTELSVLNLKPVLCVKSRKVFIQLKKYNLGYNECCYYLDELSLKKYIDGVYKPDYYIDLEAVTNSEYAIHNGVMHTYFSNTVLLSSEKDIHPITVYSLVAHALLYHVVVKKHYDALLGDLLRSLLTVKKIPIFKIIPRDKKQGQHTVIDIHKDIIFH